MALNINSYTQQAIVNPFQQRSDEARTPEQKKPEENRTQPREAASAGTQQSETRNERRAEATSSNDNETSEPQSTRRGSVLDISV